MPGEASLPVRVRHSDHAGRDVVPASADEVMTSPARSLLGWFADNEYIPQSTLISASHIPQVSRITFNHLTKTHRTHLTPRNHRRRCGPRAASLSTVEYVDGQQCSTTAQGRRTNWLPVALLLSTQTAAVDRQRRMQPFFPGPLSHRGVSLGEATDAPGEFGQPVAIPEVTDADQADLVGVHRSRRPEGPR
jgi:hypothetical protein